MTAVALFIAGWIVYGIGGLVGIYGNYAMQAAARHTCVVGMLTAFAGVVVLLLPQ